jgi:CubicO group peptidase (beta-lactamase class C family)
MKKLVTFLLSYGVLFFNTAIGREPVVSGERAQRVDRALSALSAQGMAGVFLVAENGSTILAKGYGLADVAAQRPFRRDTIFDVGSITKQFTAAGIAKLAEHGKLAFSDPLSKFFPQVPADKRVITLHQLLTHTAGVVNGLGDDFKDRVTRDELLAMAWRAPLETPPGTHFEYSNLGYAILGIVIEVVSDISYEQFLQREFFQPLGIKETGYVLPGWDAADVARLNRFYRDGIDQGTPFEKSWASNGPHAEGPYWHLRANGGILSTVDDMLQWLEALHAARALSVESRDALFKKHVVTDEQEDLGYGYGWEVSGESARPQCVAHSGADGNFISYAARCCVGNDVITAIWTINDDKKVSKIVTQVYGKKDAWLDERIMDFILR